MKPAVCKPRRMPKCRWVRRMFAFQSSDSTSMQVPWLRQFTRFCVVGMSGVVIDMTVLWLMTHLQVCGASLALRKLFSAEAALVNNFIWNEIWTFRPMDGIRAPVAGMGARFLYFHAICGLGLGWAIALLHLLHVWLGLDLYLANFLTIGLVTLWNFLMNAVFNWRVIPRKWEPRKLLRTRRVREDRHACEPAQKSGG
jgi:dolichol-phosphate mannosyltransferase